MKPLLKSTCLSALALLACGAAYAEPLAWIVSDADSRIILYPTVHALPEGLDWQSPALAGVIAASDEVWLELGDANAPGLAEEVSQLVAAFGMSPDLPLSKRLNPDQYAAFSAAVTKLGIPAEALDNFQPWLAALAMTQAELAAAGITGERGVEKVLSGLFAGRPVKNLETAAQQTRILAELAGDEQVAFLMTAVDTAGTASTRLLEITRDWAKGDLEGMEEMLIAELRADYPVIYDRLFTARNKAWADILAAELAGSGSDFIAVGAGHLIGNDSVQNLLAARGYAVRKVTISELTP
jgi:uncharacterized protein